MLSTGREYDRFFIAIVVVALAALAFYTFHTCSSLDHKQNTIGGILRNKVNDISTQLASTQVDLSKLKPSETPDSEAPSDKPSNPPAETQPPGELEPMPMPGPKTEASWNPKTGAQETFF